MAEGKWKLHQLGKDRFQLRHVDTAEYTKVYKSKQEAMDVMNRIKPTLEYDKDGKLIPKIKPPKLTQEQKRIKRLETQPPGYAGSVQAQIDSASVYKKAPQFTPGHVIAEKKRKQAEKNKEKADKAYKKVQEERSPDKLAAYVTRWHKLQEKSQDKSETERTKELAKRQLNVLLGKVDKAGLKKEFHEQILNTRLPDQIFEDPDTKKRYRYVGPDRNDPNSYEEI